LFIEQLAEVNPVHLNDDAKLAFWINLYNALMMHVRDFAVLLQFYALSVTNVCLMWENKNIPSFDGWRTFYAEHY
jgi:hypothetical protein